MSKININGPSKDITFDLPNGYTLQTIYITRVTNISALFSYIDIHAGDRITFPVVNSKSPSTLRLYARSFKDCIILIKLLIQF